MDKIKIAIAEDHQMMRESMIELLHRKFNVEVVVSANNGNELLEGVLKDEPDLVIMDINMPKKDGIETTKILKSKLPHIKILILTTFDDESLVMKLIRMKVNGYVLKTAPIDELTTAIDQIIRHGHYVNENMSEALYNSAARIYENNRFKSNYAKLDDTDIAILRLLCEELTAKEIADRLNVSARTIEGRRKKMMKNLKVKNQIGLALYAVKNEIYPG